MAVENTIIQNLNDVIETKNEIRNILRNSGMNPGSVFKEYPAMLRSVIGSGGSGGGTIDQETINSYISAYFSSYYITGDRVLTAGDEGYDLKGLLMESGAITWHPDYGESGAYDYTTLLTAYYANDWYLGKEEAATTYATKSYVADYVATYGGGGSGSGIADAYFNSYNFVYVAGIAGTLPNVPTPVNLGGDGSLTIDNSTPNHPFVGPNTLLPHQDNNPHDFVGIGTLENYLAEYATSSDLPTIDENIIPNISDTYTLGNATYYYHTLYANRIQGSSTINFRTGGNNRLTVSGTTLRPMVQNYNLGSSDYPFAAAHTSNLYADNTYISSATYLPVNTYWYDGSTYHWLGSLFS